MEVSKKGKKKSSNAPVSFGTGSLTVRSFVRRHDPIFDAAHGSVVVDGNVLNRPRRRDFGRACDLKR